MRIISRKRLKEFWERCPDVRQPLQAWYDDASQAIWKSPIDIKAIYRNASFIGNVWVVFSLKSNSYRLVIARHYEHSKVKCQYLGRQMTKQSIQRVDDIPLILHWLKAMGVREIIDSVRLTSQGLWV